jgi:hypothetical protein
MYPLDPIHQAFDSDPHFWMPMTLAKEDYVRIMLTKDMTTESAGAHFERMAAMSAKLSSEKGKFGAVDVGARSSVYWWDYGQVVYYIDNNVLMTNTDQEAAALRLFLGFGEDKTMVSVVWCGGG